MGPRRGPTPDEAVDRAGENNTRIVRSPVGLTETFGDRVRSRRGGRLDCGREPIDQPQKIRVTECAPRPVGVARALVMAGEEPNPVVQPEQSGERATQVLASSVNMTAGGWAVARKREQVADEDLLADAVARAGGGMLGSRQNLDPARTRREHVAVLEEQVESRLGLVRWRGTLRPERLLPDRAACPRDHLGTVAAFHPWESHPRPRSWKESTDRYGGGAVGRALILFLALAAGWFLRRFLAGYPRPVPAPRCLTAREWATVAAAADATFPGGGAIPPSSEQAEVAGHVDRFVAAQQPSTRILMRLLFVLVEHATLVFPAGGPGGRRRFSGLSRAQRVEVLDGWRRSALFPRRLVFTSLRAILTMGYLGDPGVLRLLGLAPPEIERRVCEADLLWGRVGEPSSAVRYRREDVTPPGPVAPIAAPVAAHRFDEPAAGAIR